MSAKKDYPTRCPVFRIEGLSDYDWDGAIVVGVGFYTQGLDVIVVSGGPSWFTGNEETSFHKDWLRPLTVEAEEMLAAVEVDRWYKPDGTRIQWTDDADECRFDP